MLWFPGAATTLPVSPVLKIPLLFAAAAGMHVTFTPPNPTPAADETVKYGYKPSYFYFNLARNLGTVTKTTNWIVTLCESSVILSYAFPSPTSADVLSALTQDPFSAFAVRLTPASVIGCALMCFGGFTRYLSYREMGRLYTWEMSVKRDHHLITTGPYSVVRHPGYTALGATSLGMVFAVLGPGSWLRECGWLDTMAGQALAGLWAGYHLWVTLKLWQRCPIEDRVLREQFPEEWDAWAKKTPYRLIPFVF